MLSIYNGILHFNSNFANHAVSINNIFLEQYKLWIGGARIPVSFDGRLLLEKAHGYANLSDHLVIFHQLVHVPEDHD